MHDLIPSIKVLTVRAAICTALSTLCLLDPARADGCFVWRNEEADIREPHQKALIGFKNGVQELVLEVKYEGAVEDFGWIVPLPAVPEMWADAPALFQILSQATQEPVYGASPEIRNLSATLGVKGDGVEILKEERVGIFDSQIVKAKGAASLGTWLRKNKFQLPKAGEKIVQEYLDRGWVFAAMKINPSLHADEKTKATLRDGTLQPIGFRFPTSKPVFPLKISSVHGGRSTVLLYVVNERPLIPDSPPEGVTWERSLFTDPGLKERIQALIGPSYLENLEEKDGFLQTGIGMVFSEEPICLGKFRATFEADQMVDLYFDPYDPARALQEGTPQQKREVLTYLGSHRPDGALELLTEHLKKTANNPTPEAVWALAQFSPDSGEVRDQLRSLVAHTDPLVRFEALKGICASPDAESLPLLMKIVGSSRDGAAQPRDENASRDRFLDKAARSAAYLALQQSIREIDPAQLREFAHKSEAGEAWRRTVNHDRPEREMDPALSILALLAAVGDEGAQATIVGALVESAQRTRHEALVKYASGRRGGTNGFPAAFWTGSAVREDRRVYGWPTLTYVLSLFADRPEVHDLLLRTALNDKELPEAAAIILLSKLLTPGDPDLARLRTLWKSSLAEPRFIESIDLRGRDYPPLRYNYRACAAVYALQKMADPSVLLELWSAAPAKDQILRSEIIHSMAKGQDARFVDTVLGFVQAQWAEHASDERIQRSVERAIGNLEKRRPDAYLAGFYGIGLANQRSDLANYLVTTLGESGPLAELYSAPDLPLVLQLHWVLEIVGHYRQYPGGRDRAIAHVEAAHKKLDGSTTLEARLTAATYKAVREHKPRWKGSPPAE